MNTNQHNQPVAPDSEPNVVAVRIDHAKLPQFEEWLEKSLDELVDRYAEFVTKNSNRRFFRQQSDRKLL